MQPFTKHMSAFANAKDGGNPAAVVVAEKFLPEAEMMSLAAEFGYPESAFLAPYQGDDSQKQWTIRYFSPQVEVDFCGHATIATGVALGQEFGAGLYSLHTNVGLVTVEVSEVDSKWVATLTSPPTAVKALADDDRTQLLGLFGWGDDDLDPAYPAKIAHAGENHPVLVLSDRAKFKAMSYDFDKLRDMMAAKHWTTISLIWVEDDGVYHARNPFPIGGIVEDPATGAAAAAFGAYVRELGGHSLKFRIHQGDDMGRPSLINVEAAKENGGPSRVTGTAERLDSPVKM